MSTWVILAFVIYMIFMLGIGIITARKNKSSDDYFLGGRNLGGWVTALSAQASDMSGWMLMGLPGCVYAFGANQAWIAIGLLIGTILNWVIVAGRLRRYTIRAGNAMTIPEYLSNRFRDKHNILITISAIVIVIFFVVYSASAFASGGKLFASITKMDYHQALIVGAVVILIYTFLGGFLAVCTTDFVQGMMMLVGVLAVPILVVIVLGTGNIVPNLVNSGLNVDAKDYLNIFMQDGKPISGISIASQLAWGLGYFGMPHILVRFMAIRDPQEVKKSRNIAMIWVLISLSVAVCIGFTGAALYPNVAELAGNGNQRIFIYMTTHLFKGLIPLFMAGVILSGILAATMSTSDSQLLIASSCVSKNLFQGLFKKEMSEEKVLLVSRITTIVIALIGIFIAMDENSSVFGLVENAWAGFGGAFGPLTLFAVFWKRTNLKGAIAGMLSGGIIALVWPVTLGKLGGIFGIYCLLPAFIVSSILIIVVSLCTEKPSDVMVKEFEEAKSLND